MRKTNRFLEQFKFHGSIVLRGIARTLYGAMISALIAVSVYGFIVISKESGYVAVFDFVASSATLLVAICNIYLMGAKKQKRGKTKE